MGRFEVTRAPKMFHGGSIAFATHNQESKEFYATKEQIYPIYFPQCWAELRLKMHRFEQRILCQTLQGILKFSATFFFWDRYFDQI